MPDWCYDEVKKLATDSKLELQELLDNIISEYIRSKKDYRVNSKKKLLFYASPVKSKPRSMWISGKQFETLEKFCDKHKTRSNRVIFTACIDKLLELGYITL